MVNIIAQYGSRGPRVEQVQKEINKALVFESRDSEKIVPDGIFGNNTRDAVAQYQRDNFLLDDGVVGQFTWAMLRGVNLSIGTTVPVDVAQGLAMRCWAAASESWLQTRPLQINRTQQELLDRLVALGGATPTTKRLMTFDVPNPMGGAAHPAR